MDLSEYQIEGTLLLNKETFGDFFVVICKFKNNLPDQKSAIRNQPTLSQVLLFDQLLFFGLNHSHFIKQGNMNNTYKNRECLTYQNFWVLVTSCDEKHEMKRIWHFP